RTTLGTVRPPRTPSTVAPGELAAVLDVLLHQQVLAGQGLDVVTQLVGQRLPRLLLPVEAGVLRGDGGERTVVDGDVAAQPLAAAEEMLRAGVEVLAHAVDVLVVLVLSLGLGEDVHAL